jgi:hypothetical protein
VVIFPRDEWLPNLCGKKDDGLFDGKQYKIIVGSVIDRKTCLLYCNDGHPLGGDKRREG